MKFSMFFLPWLVTAALFDWLVVRTFTRLAIFMPKSPLVNSIYQALTVAGNLASTISALLVMAALLWIIWRFFRPAGFHLMAMTWMSLLALSLIFLVLQPVGLSALIYHALFFLAVIMAARVAMNKCISSAEKVAILFPVLALLCGRFYQLAPILYETLAWPGPAIFTGILFNAGELFVVLSGFTLWWAFGRQTSLNIWIVAMLPMIAFIGLRLVNPSMAGILSIWSTGMTLFLPWPLYALSLWLAGVTILANFQQRKFVAVAILLFAAGGYAPQLSTQAFFGLVALWCLMAAEYRFAFNSRLDEDFNRQVSSSLRNLPV